MGPAGTELFWTIDEFIQHGSILEYQGLWGAIEALQQLKGLMQNRALYVRKAIKKLMDSDMEMTFTNPKELVEARMAIELAVTIWER